MKENNKSRKDSKKSKMDSNSSRVILPIPPELKRIAKEVVDSAFSVHSNLGPGLLESVYETCLLHELTKRGFSALRQIGFPLEYDGLTLNLGFRVDLLVENSLIVEVKSVPALAPVHAAQLLTYLKVTGCRLGFLMNFNVRSFEMGSIDSLSSTARLLPSRWDCFNSS